MKYKATVLVTATQVVDVPHDGFDSLDTGGSFANAVVLVYIHSQVVLQYEGSKDLMTDGS